MPKTSTNNSIPQNKN